MVCSQPGSFDRRHTCLARWNGLTIQFHYTDSHQIVCLLPALFLRPWLIDRPGIIAQPGLEGEWQARNRSEEEPVWHGLQTRRRGSKNTEPATDHAPGPEEPWFPERATAWLPQLYGVGIRDFSAFLRSPKKSLEKAVSWLLVCYNNSKVSEKFGRMN